MRRAQRALAAAQPRPTTTNSATTTVLREYVATTVRRPYCARPRTTACAIACYYTENQGRNNACGIPVL